MEKVKVTAKQAAEIEHYKQKGEEQIDYLIDIHSLNKRPDLAIAKMKPSQLVRALHFGYEVEPEFKVGDWVVNTSNGYIKLIENEREANFLNNDYIKRHELRHATPSEIAEEKERRWWAKHGRDVWELRNGDVLAQDKYPRTVATVMDFREKTVIFTDGDRDYYENVIDEYKVVCFSENRLDREGQQ